MTAQSDRTRRSSFVMEEAVSILAPRCRMSAVGGWIYSFLRPTANAAKAAKNTSSGTSSGVSVAVLEVPVDRPAYEHERTRAWNG